MHVRFIKNSATAKTDVLTCVHPDGTSTSLDMARQGILPHEAFHFVVETTLGWHDAMFGRVAEGTDLPTITTQLHGRSTVWAKMTQGLQCEALIECLQAEQWCGPTDPATFAQTLVTTCRRRGVVPPDITADELERVRVALREFGAAWRPLPAGGTLDRTF